MIYLYYRKVYEDLPYLITDNCKSYYANEKSLYDVITDMFKYERRWSSTLEYLDDRYLLLATFQTIDEFISNYPEFQI